MDQDDRLQALQQKIREFVIQRDWDQFHSPKNLSMALNVEAAELLEHFQWLTEEQSQNISGKTLDEVEAEIADIFIYLVRLADKLNIDLFDSADKKVKHNIEKYPADKVRGSAKKYTEYD